jgi:signal peptidase I
MKSEDEKNIERPSSEQIDREIRRRELSAEIRKSLFIAFRTLVVFAAVAVLLATLLFPTVQVQRGSMSPTLRDSEYLILVTAGRVKRGDIIAFHLGNQTLLKRVIAVAGESVNIEADGTVYVDGELLDEPYLQAKSFGECDIRLPFQVQDNQFFVMGDNRAASMDSRLVDFGTVRKEDIIGKTLARIWPVNRIGLVN